MADLVVFHLSQWKANLSSTYQKDLDTTSRMLQYAFGTGFILGGYISLRQASLQFLAEHQHELPGIKTRREQAALLRTRNSRVMWACGKGGFRRGSQLASVVAVYSLSRLGYEYTMAASNSSIKDWHLGDVVGGLCAGSLFALAAGTGQRLYQLRRGLMLGGLFGGTLTLIRHAVKYIEDNRNTNNNEKSTLITPRQDVMSIT